jgi:hypothetical protein
MPAITLCIAIGVAPWNTRRSPVRSSGGVSAMISAITSCGTATHRRAARVYPGSGSGTWIRDG